MKRSVVHIFAAVLLGGLIQMVFAPSGSAALSPTQSIKETIDAVMAVLEDPNFQGDVNASQRRDKLRTIVSHRFDYEEMAKRTLATHWEARTSNERREFVELLSTLLINSYITIIEARTDETIRYGKEQVLDRFAQVETEIVTKTGTVPVHYRLIKKQNVWGAYDISIHDVSLIGNFRKQFTRILRTASYTALVEQLKAKAAAYNSP